MSHDRRAVLSAIGLALPFGLSAQAAAPRTAVPTGPAPVLRLRSFEDAVRDAFASVTASGACRRVEVGHSELLQTGVQGCSNAFPFAGFPAGHFRIVRTGCEPGAAVSGVRLYVCTVDVVLTGGAEPGRPLDFALLPPAPVLDAGSPAACG